MGGSSKHERIPWKKGRKNGQKEVEAEGKKEGKVWGGFRQKKNYAVFADKQMSVEAVVPAVLP